MHGENDGASHCRHLWRISICIDELIPACSRLWICVIDNRQYISPFYCINCIIRGFGGYTFWQENSQ